ncbi:FliM/FliN family flagellar motor switch protein [Legionella sp. D16C41]|uniref:FliM/FliN family flagellar motor switch protein n=1 Tax=Legionella sp. D16C41 TaxID=3402688 RepID=UPI003AF467EA
MKKRKQKVNCSSGKNNYKKEELTQMANLPITINVLYGSTQISLVDFIKLKSGSIIELEQFFDEPFELSVNGKTIAQGELEKSEKGWKIRITAIDSKLKRLNCLSH